MLRIVAACSIVVLLGIGGFSGVALNRAPTEDDIQVVELAPRYHLIADRTANLVLLTGDDASMVTGVLRPSLVAAAKATMARLQAPPIRWVLALEDTLDEQYDSTIANGDGGWGRQGAITLAHERFRSRIARFGKTGAIANGMPALGFSHVVQVYLAGEEVHLIHDRRGYSDADLVVHFEKEGILYLGASFTTDGYPAIDVRRRGSITGLIETADAFLRFRKNRAVVEPIVPGRGRPATMDDLQAYRDMLAAVRDRVQAGIAAGRTRDEIVASKPTRDLDERWGRGPIAPDRFVRMVCDSITEEKPAATAPARHDHS